MIELDLAVNAKSICNHAKYSFLLYDVICHHLIFIRENTEVDKCLKSNEKSIMDGVGGASGCNIKTKEGVVA